MTRIAKNRQKSAPPRLRLSQESKEYNLPQAEHVEVSDAPENQIEPGLNDPGNSRSKVISPANVISPTNALLNARATIQTLTNSSGRKQSESPRQWPGPMIPSEFSASQQGHEVPNDSYNATATAASSNLVPFDPRYMTLNISFGHDMPPPRWILNQKPQGTGSSATLTPSSATAYNELEWVFDVGPYKHLENLENSWLGECAYKALESALDDPIQRQHIRNKIWKRNDGDFSAIEDPIPQLPPAPNTLDVTKQCKGRISGSVGENDFQYPDYERPSLAKRCVNTSPISNSTSSDNSSGESTESSDSDVEGANYILSTGTDDSSPDATKPPCLSGNLLRAFRDRHNVQGAHSKNAEDAPQEPQAHAFLGDESTTLNGNTSEVDEDIRLGYRLGAKVSSRRLKHATDRPALTEEEASTICKELGIPNMRKLWLLEYPSRRLLSCAAMVSYDPNQVRADIEHPNTDEGHRQEQEGIVAHDFANFGQYQEGAIKWFGGLFKKTGKKLKKLGKRIFKRKRQEGDGQQQREQEEGAQGS